MCGWIQGHFIIQLMKHIPLYIGRIQEDIGTGSLIINKMPMHNYAVREYFQMNQKKMID